ncbi:hypothetical protein V6N13_136526 [Hibiscus sabdariffa]|uniref:Uncharacterized protein n=1 Tax=Hibiscus sabdariffa TaxID=183260 RepID=A0ABR2DNB1_9ROSI
MGRQRKEKRLMKKLLRAGQAELREKARELGMLKRKKQSMLAEQAAKGKMVADFMHSSTLKQSRAQKFDGKAMKNTILSTMEGGWRQNEGFASDNGGKEA